jgi:hypothetical protein
LFHRAVRGGEIRGLLAQDDAELVVLDRRRHGNRIRVGLPVDECEHLTPEDAFGARRGVTGMSKSTMSPTRARA